MSIKGVNLIAQVKNPITLQGDKVEADIVLTRALQKTELSFFAYLHFDGIFGNTHCVNHEVYLKAIDSSLPSVLVGGLSFYGNRPQSDINPDGLHLVLNISKLWPELANLSTTSFKLILLPQRKVDKPGRAVINNIYFTLISPQ
ncbi:hypothetical protein [Zooshikella harenae]|uniref:Uncharacterized protein n=1 Tax=Zooshikella harenae TaxID=2827238 RepID=A0ABS5ZJ38_9GAMM|nr:hypothetical protein [Zooshikella harenae]MBU2713266.1 hypothetical protein [Zooshikella harenae]